MTHDPINIHLLPLVTYWELRPMENLRNSYNRAKIISHTIDNDLSINQNLP